MSCATSSRMSGGQSCEDPVTLGAHQLEHRLQALPEHARTPRGPHRRRAP
jgi:hypothetical protein